MCLIHTSRERNVTFRLRDNKTEIDFVLVRKEHQWFLGNAKAIPGVAKCISGSRYR